MVCFDKTGTLTEEFPKTFAYGINFIPFSTKFSKPFEELISPPLKRKPKKLGKPFQSDIRNIRKKNNSNAKISSAFKMKNNEAFMRRFTNKLSSIGDLYKIDNRDRNSSIGINTISAFGMANRITKKLEEENSLIPQEVERKGRIKDFCDSVDQIVGDIKENRMAKKYLECMSFCHTLINIDNTYIGDPLEVEMASRSPFICRYISNRKNSKFKKIYSPKRKL